MCLRSNGINTDEEVGFRTTRFCILILASLLPFGGHFIRNSFSSLETFYLADPILNINAAQYGLMISSSYLPNIFIPFLGGLIFDKTQTNSLIVLFVVISALGQIIFTVSVTQGYFNFALLGCILMGTGEGLVVTSMRAIVSHVFKSEITFAIGITISVSCISKTIAKATVVPVSNYFGNYHYGLYYTCSMCILSTISGMSLCFIKGKYDRLVDSKNIETSLPLFQNKSFPQDDIEDSSQDCNENTLLLSDKESFMYRHFNEKKCPEENCVVPSFWEEIFKDCLNFSSRFWIVCTLHTIYNLVLHLFSNFAAHFITLKYGESPQNSGYVSSLSTVLVIFIAPVIGHAVDILGGQLIVSVLSSIFVLIAFLLLIHTFINPVIAVLLLSLSHSFLPTILLSMVPLTVQDTKYGIAFGVVEVTYSITSMFGNVIMGYVKDVTNSYYYDLIGLYILAFIGTLLFIYLLVQDHICEDLVENTFQRYFCCFYNNKLKLFSQFCIIKNRR